MNAVLRSFGIIVGLPTLIAAIYFGLFASDFYVSETRFSIRASGGEAASGLGALLASPVISGGSQDSVIVADYIRSQEIVNRLDETLDLRTHYSSDSIDVVARLKKSPTREELHEYFLKRIELVEDSGGEIIVLRAESPDPNFAKLLADTIVDYSEELVNTLSNRIEADSLGSARAEVQLALERVKASNTAMTGFRSTNISINPAAETSALLGIVSGLESSVASTQAELSEKRAFMKEDSVVVKTLKNKIAALNGQLKKEKRRLVGKDGEGMNQLISDYQPLALDQELAQQQYASALTSLELARIEAQRKKLYLVTFVKPGLPEEALKPERILKIMTTFVYAFLLFSIGGLMWSALRDHVGF